MTKRYIILEGQSNAVGFGTIGLPGAPSGLPEAGVTLNRAVAKFGGQHIIDGTPVALQVTDTAADPTPYWGVECQLGLDLLAAGEDVTIMKCCASGTSVLEWDPANSATDYYGLMVRGVQGGRARSGDYSVHIVSIRGEAESSNVDPTPADDWRTDYLAGIYSGMTFLAGVAPRVHICRVSSNYASAIPAQLATVRAKQSEVAIVTGGYLYNADWCTTADGIHYDPASINALGSMLAKGILSEILYEPTLFFATAV